MQIDDPAAGASRSRRTSHASSPPRNRAREARIHLDLMLFPCLARVQEPPLHRRPSSRHPHHTSPPPPNVLGPRLGGRARLRRIRCGGYSSPRRRPRSWCLLMWTLSPPMEHPSHPPWTPPLSPHGAPLSPLMEPLVRSLYRRVSCSALAIRASSSGSMIAL